MNMKPICCRELIEGIGLHSCPQIVGTNMVNDDNSDLLVIVLSGTKYFNYKDYHNSALFFYSPK